MYNVENKMSEAKDQRIKQVESLLIKYGLSNQWLAKRLGVNHTSINSWLSTDGSRPRDPRIYDQMLDILETVGKAERTVEMRRAGVRTIPVYAGIPAGNPGAIGTDGKMVVTFTSNGAK